MSVPKTSVVICVRNQAPRLRLVLRGLSTQTIPPTEIIVVDDASSDEIAETLEHARSFLRSTELVYVRNETALGSPGARNVGIARARGDVVLFLDSDALPGPLHVATHLAAHSEHPRAIAFGPLWHVPSTEYLRDPATGERFDVEIPADKAAALEARLRDHLVTDDDVTQRFPHIVARALPGGYPGIGHMEAAGQKLGAATSHPAIWVLMSPHNASVPRDVLGELGGFDASLPFCEGWDLSLRALRIGVTLVRADAPTYHLYHYRPMSSFAQHLKRWVAQRRIAEKQGQRAILLVGLFYSFPTDRWLPREMGPFDLDHYGEILARYPGADIGPYETILRGHPWLSELAAAE